MKSTADPNLVEARAAYFERSGFAPDGGYDDEWVTVDMGRFNLKFPNSDARRRAVRYHDLHHVVTGYDTDLTGEAEIGAWEVASSCRGFVAAWILNLLVFGYRLPLEPGRLFRAFVRGRHSQNLYGYVYDENLLARSVRELREELGLISEPAPARGVDRLAFGFWSVIASTLVWGPFIAIIACVASWLG